MRPLIHFMAMRCSSSKPVTLSRLLAVSAWKAVAGPDTSLVPMEERPPVMPAALSVTLVTLSP